MPIIQNIKIKVARDEVLRMLRHNPKTTIIDKRTNNIIDSLIADGKNLAVPIAAHKRFWVKGSSKHTIVLEGINFDIIGASIAHHLWNSEGVSFFAVTIGADLDRQVQEFTKAGRLSSAVILDTVGSVAVESAADYVNNLIEADARTAGYKITKRYSPGYGDWQLKEQKGLLNLLDASKIGIRLSAGYQMQPQKSVSAVIGWFK